MNKKENKIPALERRLGYHFTNHDLLMRALTHKSAHVKHNERLEFLGDALLNLVVADLLYQQFPKASEGVLTRARASLVNKTTLCLVATELSIGEHLQLGIGERRSGGFRRESILADTLEAIMGAIYLDSDFMSCYQCIERWFKERLVVLNPEEQEKDPKTRLQEWLQANHHALPQYQVISIEGEPHAQVFMVNCTIDALSLVAEGSGESRRIAEQQAARRIWELIHL